MKTCDFNIQILIQSKKENLSKYFYNLKKNFQKEENNKIKEMLQNYSEFLKRKNEENKAASKNFYIIIKQEIDISKREIDENIVINYLNECYFKIKESLSRCGNIIYEINSKSETEQILNSFFNPQKNNF